MKRSLKNIVGYNIQCKDNTWGKVIDLLFDEETWIIRYIEAVFEGLDPRKRVLIPHSSMNPPNWQNKTFQLDLNRSQIEKSPSIDEHMPVSREYEKKLFQYYNLNPYWPYSYIAPESSVITYPQRPIKVPEKDIREEDLDTNLRSFKEIKGYRISGTNNTMGQIDDLIADDEDWQIIYLIIDTSRWLPWSKSVVLSIEWLKNISYENKEVAIDFDTSQIKKAPKYDPSHPIDMDYERALDAYYKENINQIQS